MLKINLHQIERVFTKNPPSDTINCTFWNPQVYHEEWLKMLFENGTLEDKSDRDNIFTGFKQGGGGESSSASQKKCIIM